MRRIRPDHPRALFAAALRAFNDVRAEQATLGHNHPIYGAYRATLRRNALAAGVSRAKCNRALLDPSGQKFQELLGEDTFGEITEFFQGQAEELYEDLKERAATHNCELDRLVALTEPMPGNEQHVYREVWVSTYSSQPNKLHYARVFAEICAEDLTRHELQALIVERHDNTSMRPPGAWLPKRVLSFDVCVLVRASLDIELAKRSPKRMPLQEAVRLSWAKGANPRVYWPMLPHGFEEQHGFDWYGRPTR